MKLFKLALAAALVALPALLTSAPAGAATARQYHQQGRGHYISSKGRKPSRAIYHRHHRGHRYYR